MWRFGCGGGIIELIENRWKAIANAERLYTPSTAETSTASIKSVAISPPGRKIWISVYRLGLR